jgi:predicted nucleotidyltransferase
MAASGRRQPLPGSEAAYDAVVTDALSDALETEPRLAYALLFGSTARGEAHARSDLDIAIALAAGGGLDRRERGTLIARLESATRRSVHLVDLDEAGPALAYRAFRDGRELLVRDRRALVARKARAILDYLDFRPFEERLAAGALAVAAHGR